MIILLLTISQTKGKWIDEFFYQVSQWKSVESTKIKTIIIATVACNTTVTVQ